MGVILLVIGLGILYFEYTSMGGLPQLFESPGSPVYISFLGVILSIVGFYLIISSKPRY